MTHRRITVHRPTSTTDDTRSCHRCGITIPAWKRTDRTPTPRSGLCADCRSTDPVYLDLVLGRNVRRPEPQYDEDTRDWVGEVRDVEALIEERFDRAAIIRERPATTVRRDVLAREVEAAEQAQRAHILHAAMEGTTAARAVRR